MDKKLIIPIITFFVAILYFGFGCDRAEEKKTGVLKLNLTDAPGDYEEVYITFTEVTVHKSGDDDNETDNDTTSNDNSNVNKGIMDNDLYGYSLDVGDASKYTVKDDIVEWAVAWYTYCYELEEETDYEDITCGKGKVGVFNIAVYSQDQYDEISASPYADTYPLLGTQYDLYFTLEWPNGVLPEEVPVEELYDRVEKSFTLEEE